MQSYDIHQQCPLLQAHPLSYVVRFQPPYLLIYVVILNQVQNVVSIFIRSIAVFCFPLLVVIRYLRNLFFRAVLFSVPRRIPFPLHCSQHSTLLSIPKCPQMKENPVIFLSFTRRRLPWFPHPPSVFRSFCHLASNSPAHHLKMCNSRLNFPCANNDSHLPLILYFQIIT